MSFESNQYYKISSVGAEAEKICEGLLRSYPLTQTFLKILGDKLIKELEFGFFSAGEKIIVQAETGKDLFLLCSQSVDVIVDKKLIVQLSTPILVGDKGIIDRKSIRTATIAISEGADSLVIKIPMGTFMRDFITNKELDDKDFMQEITIYNHLFMEVQNRLFKYGLIQRNLWEEVKGKLKSLNINLLSKIILDKKQQGWTPKTWNVVKKYLASFHQFEWPDNTEPSVEKLNGLYREILEKSLPRDAFKGSDMNYKIQKELIWRKWLNRLSEVLVRVLPEEQLPVNLGEVELFNPANFQNRMSRLITSILENFIRKKVNPKSDKIKSDTFKPKRFFAEKSDKNIFNLELYLNTIRKLYALKRPNRVLGQIAQQIAQETARCENEFNSSVSKMQQFMDKVKNITSAGPQSSATIVNTDNLEKITEDIYLGLTAYNKRQDVVSGKRFGEIKYENMATPTVQDLIKSCATEQNQEKVNTAFHTLLADLNLNVKGLTKEDLEELFYLSDVSTGDKTSDRQLQDNYWIPVFPGTVLKKGEVNVLHVEPGCLLGGACWQLTDDKELEKNDYWSLFMSETEGRKEKMICTLPSSALPWKIDIDPLSTEFQKKYLPLIQWMVNTYIGHISRLYLQNVGLFKKYSDLVKTVETEKRVRLFEKNKEPLTDKLYNAILSVIDKTLGIQLERKASITTEQLSRQLYIFFLKEVKEDFPKLSREDRSNKAYGLWRYAQSEIVAAVSGKRVADQVNLKKPASVFSVIEQDLKAYLKEQGMEPPDESIEASKDNIYISLAEIVGAFPEDMQDDKKLGIVHSIVEVFERFLKGLIDEIFSYEQQLEKIGSIDTEVNIRNVKSSYISELVEQLETLLNEKSPEPAISEEIEQPGADTGEDGESESEVESTDAETASEESEEIPATDEESAD